MKILSDEFKNQIIKTDKTKMILGAVAIILAIIILFIMISGGKTPSDIVKNGTFYQYPDKQVGQAFDDYFGANYGEWYDYQNNVVVYKANKNGHSVVMKFKVDEETEEFTVESLTLDGIESLYMLDTVLYDIYSLNYY